VPACARTSARGEPDAKGDPRGMRHDRDAPVPTRSRL